MSNVLSCKSVLESFCKLYELNLNQFQEDGEWYVTVKSSVGRPCVCYSAISDAAYLGAKSSSTVESAFKSAVDLILHHDRLAWIDEDGDSIKLDMSKITTLEQLAILVDLNHY